MLRIAVDADIPYAEQVFARFGEVSLFKGRQLRKADIRSADALIVRTVTRVDAALVKGTRLRFVGTASSGEDHIDREALQNYGISYANAHGCNARPVVEYVLTVLAEASIEQRLKWGKTRIGLMGCGAVGGLLAETLAAMNWPLLVCDPLLPEERRRQLGEKGIEFVDQQSVLNCKVVSLHVPLTTGGNHPTASLINAPVLEGMAKGVLLINASRGEVIDEQTVLHFVNVNREGLLALDVWQCEPDIDVKSLEQVQLATPHIAGYSALAKLRAVNKLASAAHKIFALPGLDSQVALGGSAEAAALEARERIVQSQPASVPELLAQVLPLADLSAELKTRYLQAGSTGGGGVFDGLRKSQLSRVEFSQIALSKDDLEFSGKQWRQLDQLGFTLID